MSETIRFDAKDFKDLPLTITTDATRSNGYFNPYLYPVPPGVLTIVGNCPTCGAPIYGYAQIAYDCKRPNVVYGCDCIGPFPEDNVSVVVNSAIFSDGIFFEISSEFSFKIPV